MEEVINEGEVVEVSEVVSEDSQPLQGLTNEGVVYTPESPAVIAYLAQFPDTALDVAIGSVVSMHNRLAGDEIPAGENLEAIIELIRANIVK